MEHRSFAARLTVVAALALLVPLAPAADAARPSRMTESGDMPAAGAAASPVLASDNVRHLATVPSPGGYIALAFSRRAPYAYAASSRGVDVLDIGDPRHPRVVGFAPVPDEWTEDIAVGERPDGTTFVLLGSVGSTGTSAAGTPLFALYVVDVTQPTRPFLRSQMPLYAHTVTCVDATCRYAYGSTDINPLTGEPFITVLDLADLDRPRQAAAVPSLVGVGHDWNRDGAGVMWHVGERGIAAYDASDPRAPVPLNASDASGTSSPYNDLQIHGSLRPHAERFRPFSPPALDNGNVLVTAEEARFADCSDMLATWYVPELDAGTYAVRNPTSAPSSGTITPLDIWTVELFEEGQQPPAGAMCYPHWFDYHQHGFLAVATFQYGTRILDIREPAHIRQVGYLVVPGGESYAAYWVPRRNAAGGTTGAASTLVYAVDWVRGLDVLEVDLPAGPPGTSTRPAPILPAWRTMTALPVRRPSPQWGWACPLPR